MAIRHAAMAAACVLGLTAAAPPASAAGCMISTRRPPADAPRFEAYPARAEVVVSPAPPSLTSYNLRQYRTVLREAAAKGPSFAGHYAVATWGCGAGCYSWALIDSRSGRVFNFPEASDVAIMNVDVEDNPPAHRLNSRLIVVAGAPNEDEKRDGLSYFEFDGQRLHLVRFYAYGDLCRPKR